MNLLSKFSKGFLAVAMFGAISAAAFTEGEDYVKLQKPLPVEQNTLVKVFTVFPSLAIIVIGLVVGKFSIFKQRVFI